MANELKYHMNMLNSIDKKVGGPGNWTYIIDALNSIDTNLGSVGISGLIELAQNAYPSESASGNPIYFDDGADDIPVKELIVNLEPKQSGSGDPSPTNVRPITGYDGVTVTRSGKNILDPNIKFTSGTYNGVTVSTDNGYIYKRAGTATSSGTVQTNVIATSDAVILPAGTYTSVGGTFNLYKQNGSFLANKQAGTWTVDEPFFVKMVYFELVSGMAYNNTYFIALAKGSVTPTEYEPYTEQEYSITFPSSVGTVYGGTLNVTTGELVVDRYNLWLDPTKIPDGYIHFEVLTNNVRVGNLILSTHFGLTSAYTAKYSSEGTFRNGALSNWSVEKNKGYSSDTSGFYFSGADRFYLFCPKSIFATQDAAGFKQYLTNNPLYICYQLATPITYQLAPSEVTTLLMGNTIWSDNGEISLTYRADTATVINKLKEASA